MDGYEMMRKAWNDIEEVPYRQSQLSNLADLFSFPQEITYTKFYSCLIFFPQNKNVTFSDNIPWKLLIENLLHICFISFINAISYLITSDLVMKKSLKVVGFDSLKYVGTVRRMSYILRE